MTCPSDARLRTHVDVDDPGVIAHLGECGSCAQSVATARDDARFAARAIAGLDGAVAQVDVEGALARTLPRPAALSDRRGPRLRAPASVAAGLVAALVAALVVFTPTGRQAAADFLASFRSERLQVVTFDPDQSMADLDELGEVVEVDADEPRQVEVDGPREAADVAGFEPARATSLPDDAQLERTTASSPTTVRLTFRAGQAPELPSALDGAQLVASVPGAVVAQYAVGRDVLVVAEAGQLEVQARGADLGQIREYLLSRPEVPQDLARQLLAIDDWTTTLPIPVPVDEIAWRDTTVAGQPALMLEDPMGSGLLWQRDGRIHAVGGSGIDADALREIADGLR